jgi:hypothetical protein
LNESALVAGVNAMRGAALKLNFGWFRLIFADRLWQ